MSLNRVTVVRGLARPGGKKSSNRNLSCKLVLAIPIRGSAQDINLCGEQQVTVLNVTIFVKTLMSLTEGLHVLVIHVVQPGRSSLSLMMPARSNNFCVGGHLNIENRKSQSDRLFNEHPNQKTFG